MVKVEVELDLFSVPNANLGWFASTGGAAPDEVNGNNGAAPPAAAGRRLGVELVVGLAGCSTFVNKDEPLTPVEVGSAFFSCSAGAPNGEEFGAEKLNDGFEVLFTGGNPNDGGKEIVGGCGAAGVFGAGLLEDLGAKKSGIEDAGAGAGGLDVLGAATGRVVGLPKSEEVVPAGAALTSFAVGPNVNGFTDSFTTGPVVEPGGVAALASAGLSEG